MKSKSKEEEEEEERETLLAIDKDEEKEDDEPEVVQMQVQPSSSSYSFMDVLDTIHDWVGSNLANLRETCQNANARKQEYILDKIEKISTMHMPKAVSEQKDIYRDFLRSLDASVVPAHGTIKKCIKTCLPRRKVKYKISFQRQRYKTSGFLSRIHHRGHRNARGKIQTVLNALKTTTKRVSFARSLKKPSIASSSRAKHSSIASRRFHEKNSPQTPQI